MNIIIALMLSGFSQNLPPCTTVLGQDKNIDVGALPSPPVPVKQDFDCLLRYAQDGDIESQYDLGMIYIRRKYYNNGIKWIEQAAVRGHSWAKYQLGKIYKLGLGVQIDLSASEMWFQKAANEGVEPAQYETGLIYKNRHNAVDYKIAKGWFQKAAEQGSVAAQFELGYYYFRGPPEEKDYVLAYKWLYLSVTSGALNNKAAQIAGDELVGHMTEEQIAEGERLAKAWSQTTLPN